MNHRLVQGIIDLAIHIAGLAALCAFAGIAYSGDGDRAFSFYAGTEVGSAHANTTIGIRGPKPTPLFNPSVGGWQIPVDTSAVGWSAFTGVRFGKFVGVELKYTDFGTAKVNYAHLGNNYVERAEAKNEAVAGYIVGYLPLSTSRWDVFAKAGYAHLDTTTYANGTFTLIECVATTCFGELQLDVSASETTDAFAYGLGAQYRFTSLGVRVEFQKITASHAAPDLFSLGATWTF